MGAMRKKHRMDVASIGQGILFTLAAALFGAMWTPFGLLFGLTALYFFAVAAALWILKEKHDSGGIRCADCAFYQPTGEGGGTCLLTGGMAWPKSVVCDDFVAPMRPKVSLP